MKPYAIADIWKGTYVYARYDIPFFSDISSSVMPPPDAVRSDVWKYLDRDYSFENLMIDQVVRLSEGTFARMSCGYFEKMYAGIGAEVLTFLREGNLALGLEGDWAIKREPGTQFELMDFNRYTILGNAYYYSPGLGMTLRAQYGRYLAGDVGWVFDVGREYDTGIIVGCWYSFTDTDDLSGSFNRGYHDKGVFLSLPIRIFFDHDSVNRYSYAMSPWTRDVAASVYHWRDLYGMGINLMPAYFKARLEKIRE